MCLAPSGTGKEAARSGINKLNKEVGFLCPTAINYRGADEIVSGPALIKDLSKNKCQLSIIGEFVIKMRDICGSKANSHESAIRRAMLQLFNLSGKNDSYGRTIYANPENNIDEIESPNFSLFCEGIPKTFNAELNDNMFMDGFLPRFLIIKYDGLKPYPNKHHDKAVPTEGLIQYIANLVEYVESITFPRNNKRRTVVDVQSNIEAANLLDKILNLQIEKENETDDDRKKAIWSRYYINTYKLAALPAIFDNIYNSIIRECDVNWANQIVLKNIELLLKDVDEGKVGNVCNETNQQNELIRIMKEFINKDWKEISGYCRDNRFSEILYKNKIIPLRFINKRLSNMKAFSEDRLKSTAALERAIKNLLQTDVITEVNKNQLMEHFNTKQRAFMFSDMIKVRK